MKLIKPFFIFNASIIALAFCGMASAVSYTPPDHLTYNGSNVWGGMNCEPQGCTGLTITDQPDTAQAGDEYILSSGKDIGDNTLEFIYTNQNDKNSQVIVQVGPATPEWQGTCTSVEQCKFDGEVSPGQKLYY